MVPATVATPSDLKVSLAATKDRGVFAVSVRNVSHRGISVVMGSRCGDSKDLNSVSYRLTNEAVVTVDFDDMTGTEPCSTHVLFIVDLIPGGSYTWDMHLDYTTLVGDEALLRAVTSGNHAYRLQAVLKAEGGVGRSEKSAKYRCGEAPQSPPWCRSSRRQKVRRRSEIRGKGTPLSRISSLQKDMSDVVVV
jgi:hypothetical protein